MFGRLGFGSALTAVAALTNNNDSPKAREKDVRFIVARIGLSECDATPDQFDANYLPIKPAISLRSKPV